MAGRGTDIVLGGNPNVFAVSILRDIFSNKIDGLTSTVDNNIEKLYRSLDDNEIQELKENFEETLTIVSNNANTIDKPSVIKFKELYFKILSEMETKTASDKSKVLSLGGLHVIGTERHESRRIDNQLRGRSGRQGDPGSSRFFLSLEDKLLRLFGGDKVLDIMQNVGFDDATPIQSPLLNNSLESAQKKVEAYYFDTRKQLFEYDQALTMQRNGIYEERKRILQRNNLRCWILEYAERTLYDLIIYINEREDKNAILLTLKIQELFGTPFKFDFILNNENPNQSILFFQQQFQIGYTLKEVEMEAIEPGLIRELERSFLLQQIDNSWKEHLQKISLLRESIRWRAYGQKDPLTEYKKEAYNFFVITMTRIRHRVVYFILRAKLVIE